jgi:TetR/AcrR family transcriptional regulator, mexJK operon transcriptional repressor
VTQALRNDARNGAAARTTTRTRRLEARREQLIAAAERHFLQYGYAQTSVNAIVREAGGSLATLYAEFSSKEALFESVLSARTAKFFPGERSALADSPDAPTQLCDLATHMLRRMLSDSGLAVYRIAVHEAPRFPALRKAMLEVGMAGLLNRTACYLRELANRGVLRIDAGEDAARVAASQFIALVQGQLLVRAACGEKISAQCREDHVAAAVSAFLKIYG